MVILGQLQAVRSRLNAVQTRPTTSAVVQRPPKDIIAMGRPDIFKVQHSLDSVRIAPGGARRILVGSTILAERFLFYFFCISSCLSQVNYSNN